MPITSTTFTAVRDLFAVKLREISGLTVYDYPTGSIDALPSVEIIWPRFRRVSVDDAEPQLGSVLLTTFWALKVRVSADEYAQATADEFALLGQIIAKFDANETLGTTAADGFSVMCRVTDGDVEDDPVIGDAKPTRGYRVTLEIRQLL